MTAAVKPVIMPFVFDPARLSWGEPATFRQLTGATHATARYWAYQVFRPKHNIAHPVRVAGCPGCKYEAVVLQAARDEVAA